MSPGSRSAKYFLLNQQELEVNSIGFDTTNCKCDRPIRWRLLPYICAGSLLLNFLFLGNSLIRSIRVWERKTAHTYKSNVNAQLKAVSAYSPILDALDLDAGVWTFNGAFRDNTSIYRMPPSPEVDAAWNYVSMEGLEIITVSALDISESGKDPALSVQAPPYWQDTSEQSAGETSFPAQIDVFHQIHCLNQLRKEAFYDHYFEGVRGSVQEAHLGHCIHMLLQTLMCASDVGIIQHNWVYNEQLPEPKTRPMPDFNMVKQCRDFESLRAWAVENSIPNLHEKWNALRIPEGACIVPGDGYA